MSMIGLAKQTELLCFRYDERLVGRDGAHQECISTLVDTSISTLGHVGER